ncbi:MAG: hypothetical protein JWN31_216 [Frankiales bacterium]|nr:hypothetical protein [Frankiales bacterium]
MDCCDSTHHEITVQAGGSSVSLLRCGHCSQQCWTVDGVPVEREAAFAQLSTAYSGVPRAAKAARTRTIAERETRLAERRRQQAERTPVPTSEEAEPVASELARMLEGWQVLGSSSG